MKNSILRKLIIISLPALLLSCSGLSVNYSGSQSWLIRENKFKESRPTLTLLTVQVDMTGSRDSIEKEATALAPLYFWNRRCKVVPAAEKPDYAAKIHVREREIGFGLRTKKSLAVEVLIWKYEDAPGTGTPVHEQKLPVAVGRVITIGEKSFSSSEITGKLLSKTIKIAAKKLTVHKRRNKNA